MKIGGIVAEYNPFHNGHKYQIEEYKRIHGITHLVIAISGNFIQRGGPSIVDKYSRAEMALKNGADLVLEIPAFMSTQTAELYAKGGVLTLDSLGCVDSMCFGSELGNINMLKESARIILGEKGNYEESIRKHLNSGDSFPVAREKAITENLTIEKNLSLKYIDFLKKSNNILGIEYIKELIKIKSSIVPETIERNSSSHNSGEVEGRISSATSIRNLIFQKKEIGHYVPEESRQIIESNLSENIEILNDESFFSDILSTIIRDEDLTRYFDVDESISNTILNDIFSSKSIYDFLEKTSSKTYTKSRLRRCLFNILLNIKKEDIEFVKKIETLPYSRVIGFNDRGRGILKKSKVFLSEKIDNKEFDIIMSPAKVKRKDIYMENNVFKTLLDFDLKSSNMYYQKLFSNNRILLSKGEIDYITLKRIL